MLDRPNGNFLKILSKGPTVTLYELQLGKQGFNDHYLGPDGSKNFSKEITVDWASFKAPIVDAIKNGYASDNLALKFIHRYDANTTPKSWYLCMVVCQITLTKYDPVHGKPVFKIEEISRYDIKDSQNVISSLFVGAYDPNYFTLQYFDGASTAQLNYNDATKPRHVQSIVFPWVEIQDAFTTNENVDPATVIKKIKFSSYSFDTTGETSYSEVVWPHGIVITFIDDAGNELIGDDWAKLPYFLRGANLGTLCPPNCDRIVWPY